MQIIVMQLFAEKMEVMVTEDRLLLLEQEQILQQVKLEFLVLTLMVLLTQETVAKFVLCLLEINKFEI